MTTINNLINRFDLLDISETTQNEANSFYVTMKHRLRDKEIPFELSLRQLNQGLRRFKEFSISPKLVSTLLKSVCKEAQISKTTSRSSKRILKFLNRIGERKWHLVAYLKKTGKHFDKITKNFSKLARLANYKYAKYCPALVQYKIIKVCYNSIETLRERQIAGQICPSAAIFQKNLLLEEIKIQHKKLRENKRDEIVEHFIEKSKRKVLEELEGDTFTRLPNECILTCKGDKIKVSPRAK